MNEDLKEQIEKLQEDPMYVYLLDMISGCEISEKNFAEMYIQQESPFAEMESEN